MKPEKKYRKDLSRNAENFLWAVSGGRCEICNKLLYQDYLTKKHLNAAQKGHIYDVNPHTHRYDAKKSKELETSVENLILVCYDHHKLIDKEWEKDYSAEKLMAMKKAHEDRIKRLTEITKGKERQIIIYHGPVGEQFAKISNGEASYYIAEDGYYPTFNPVDISADMEFRDDENAYWDSHATNLIRKYKRLVENTEIVKSSVFAFAPQPLLILLGTLFYDANDTMIYPKNRDEKKWGWRAETEKIKYKVTKPKAIKDTVALNISLSASITNDRITAVLGDDCSIWKVSIKAPNNNFLKTQEQQENFKDVMRKLLDEIKKKHGEGVEVNVFPAMPVALAIELGRLWMPKADLPLIIYDQNSNNGGFYRALKIPYNK